MVGEVGFVGSCGVGFVLCDVHARSCCRTSLRRTLSVVSVAYKSKDESKDPVRKKVRDKATPDPAKQGPAVESHLKGIEGTVRSSAEDDQIFEVVDSSGSVVAKFAEI